MTDGDDTISTMAQTCAFVIRISLIIHCICIFYHVSLQCTGDSFCLHGGADDRATIIINANKRVIDLPCTAYVMI